MLGGLDRATEGKVIVDGNDIFAMSDEKLTIFRRRSVGFIFQSYNLVPILNVLENILLPIELDGGRIDQKYLDEVIQALGLQGKSTICRLTFPAGNSNVLRLPERWQLNLPLFWLTSLQGIWIAKRAKRFLFC